MVNFFIYEDGKALYSEGDILEAYSPCSTFKVVISLMGYENGVLLDDLNPKWEFSDKYLSDLPRMFDIWRGEYTPRLWMLNSAVWYSQVITQKLGLDKFRQHIESINYGNKDITGDLGKENGLTNSWLSSSLKISAKGQIDLIQGLANESLPFSESSMRKTKDLIFVENLNQNWQLFGKTGSGFILDEAGNRKPNHQIGWYVGWLQMKKRIIIFSHFIEGDDFGPAMAGSVSKVQAIEKLTKLLAKGL